jgi:hypothetical protein
VPATLSTTRSGDSISRLASCAGTLSTQSTFCVSRLVCLTVSSGIGRKTIPSRYGLPSSQYASLRSRTTRSAGTNSTKVNGPVPTGVSSNVPASTASRGTIAVPWVASLVSRGA